MSRYVNVQNTSGELLKVEFVPRSEASTISFKGEAPLNFKHTNGGTYGFSLASTLNDRTALVQRQSQACVLVQKINGEEVTPGIILGWANGYTDYNWFSEYDYGQLGIGTFGYYNNTVVAGESVDSFTRAMVNLKLTETIVLEGEIFGDTETPVLYTSSMVNSVNDENLNPGAFLRQGNKFGIALGNSNNPVGTGITYESYINDPDNTLLESNLVLYVTVTSPGADPVTVSAYAGISRESTSVTWADAVEWETVNSMIVDDLNNQYGEYIFSNARHGYNDSAFQIYVGLDLKNNPYFLNGSAESLDGTEATDPSMSEIEPSLMAISATSMEDTGSMGDVSAPTYPTDSGLTNRFYFGMWGYPNDGTYDPDVSSTGYGYIPVQRYVTLHIDASNIDMSEPFSNVAHNAGESILGKYGADANDFVIASAGSYYVEAS